MRRLALTVLTLAAACDDNLPMDTGFDAPERIGTDVNESWDPRLAVSSNGHANVLWLALGADNDWSVWSNRFLSEIGWEGPRAIEQADGSAQWPALVADDDGNVIAGWTNTTGTTNSVLTSRLLAESGWGAADLMPDAISPPRLAMNRFGYAMMVWRLEPSARLVAARFDPATGWTAPELIDVTTGNPSSTPLVAMDSAGNAIVVWDDSGAGLDRPDTVLANRYGVGSGWGTPLVIASSDQDAKVTSLAMNRAGDAVVMTYEFTQGPGSGVFATYFDRTTGWQAHTLVERPSHPNIATAAIDEDGHVIASWQKIGGLPSDVYAARRERGGGWGEPELIGVAQDEHGLGDDHRVSLVVSPDGRVLAAWKQINGAWLNRYVPGVGWGSATVLRAADTTLPQLGVDNDGRITAVWIESGDVFAASAPGESGR